MQTRNYTYANAASTWGRSGKKIETIQEHISPFLQLSSLSSVPPTGLEPNQKAVTSEPGRCSLQASFHMPWSPKEVIGGQSKVASRQ